MHDPIRGGPGNAGSPPRSREAARHPQLPNGDYLGGFPEALSTQMPWPASGPRAPAGPRPRVHGATLK